MYLCNFEMRAQTVFFAGACLPAGQTRFYVVCASPTRGKEKKQRNQVKVPNQFDQAVRPNGLVCIAESLV